MTSTKDKLPRKLCCPNCGRKMQCSRSEEGGWDEYIGLYTHTCSKCGFTEKSDFMREGVVGAYDDPQKCPLVHTYK